MLAGQLEIQLVANMARLQNDMDVANRSVGRAMSSIDSAVGMAKTALGALGAVSLVAAFAANIKAAIDQADALNKLAQRTGLATETLSQLQYAAKMAGIANDTLSTGIKKLNISIAEGLAGDKAKIAMFQELGIKLTDTSGKAKKADTVLLDMADTFAIAKDGAGKTTIAVGLLGKAGDEMIPMLNGGRGAVMDLMREADKLGLTIGTDFARQAEEFNDNLERVHASSQKLTIVLAADLVDGLGKAMKAMADATIEGGKLQGIIMGIHTLFRGDEMHKANVDAVKGVELLQAAENALTKARADGDTVRAARLEKTVALRRAEAEDANRYRKTLEAEQTKSEEAAAAVNRARTEGRELKARNEAAEAAAAKAAAEALRKQEEQAKLLAELAGLTGGFAKDWANLTDLYRIGKLDMQGLEQAQARLLSKQPAIKQAHDDELKYWHDVAQARSDLRNREDEGITAYLAEQQAAIEAAVKASDEELKAAQATYAQYGLSKSQIAEITLLTLQGEQAKLHAASTSYVALQKQIDNQKKLIGILADTEALDAQKAMWVSIEQAAHTTFTNIFDGGQDAFTKLRDTLKATLLDLLYQMTVKRWIFDISASVSGSNVAGAAMPGMAGGASSLLSSAGSAAGIFGAGGMTGAMAGGAGWLTGATTLGGSVSAATSLMALEGGFAAGASMLAGAMLPIAAGVAVLAKLFEKGEYVKSTGSSVMAFDGTGATTGKSVLSNNFASTEADAYVQGIKDAYTNLTKSLGATNPGGSFAYAANNSDGGKFGVQVGVGSASYSTGELKATDEALKLEAARAVFAALQGSELPTFLSGVFDGITATTATQEQINTALTYAQGLKAIHDQLEAMNVKGLSKSALDGLAQFSGGIANLSANLAGFNSNFLSEEEKRAQTIATIVDTLNAAGAQLTAADVAATTRETFKALVQGVKDLETEAGQKTYAALLSVQGAFASVTEATKEATVALVDQTDAQRELQAAWSAEGARLDAINKAKADALLQAQQTVAALRNEATTAYIAAQQRVTAAQLGVANVLHSTIASFEDVINGMNGGRNVTDSRAVALGNLQGIASRARGGDTAAWGQLPAAVKAFTTLSAEASATREDFRRDEAYARAILQEGIAAGKQQLTTLPVEMQKATDPIKAAYDELAKATKAEQDARVLAIAMQASLTATEKTLAEKYLEAIKGLPEGEALKAFYDETMAAAAAAAAIATASATAAQAILATLAANAATALAAANTATATTTTAQSGLSMLGNGLIRKDGADGTSLFWARDVAAGLNDYAAANGSLAATQRAYELGATTAMLEEIRKASVGLPQFAKGTNYLDRDMVIQAHRGETITPANYVDVERSAREEANSLLAQLVGSNATLTARLDAMVSAAITTAANTGETAAASQRNVGLVEQICFGGVSVQTRAAGTPA